MPKRRGLDVTLGEPYFNNRQSRMVYRFVTDVSSDIKNMILSFMTQEFTSLSSYKVKYLLQPRHDSDDEFDVPYFTEELDGTEEVVAFARRNVPADVSISFRDIMSETFVVKYNTIRASIWASSAVEYPRVVSYEVYDWKSILEYHRELLPLVVNFVKHFKECKAMDEIPHFWIKDNHSIPSWLGFDGEFADHNRAPLFGWNWDLINHVCIPATFSIKKQK